MKSIVGAPDFDTVMIDSDVREVRLTWHAALPCAGREHRLSDAIVNCEGGLEYVSA